jgi:hypothetical protein
VISSAFLLAAASCKKSNNNSSGSGVSATVGGTGWAANSTTEGLFVTAQGQFEIGSTQLKGGDTTAFIIYFSTPFTLGRAMNSDTAFVDLNYVDSKTGNLYDGGNEAGWSILTVTSYDSTGHNVGGTFNGVLYNLNNLSDSLTVTNGKFSSSFQVQ